MGLRFWVPGLGEFQRVVGFRVVEQEIELNWGEKWRWRACLAEVACFDFWMLALCVWDRRLAQCSCCLLLQFGKLELGEDAWFMPNNECIEKICWDVRATS